MSEVVVLWMPTKTAMLSKPVNAVKRIHGYIVDGYVGSKRVGSHLFETEEEARERGKRLLRNHYELARKHRDEALAVYGGLD